MTCSSHTATPFSVHMVCDYPRLSSVCVAASCLRSRLLVARLSFCRPRALSQSDNGSDSSFDSVADSKGYIANTSTAWQPRHCEPKMQTYNISRLCRKGQRHCFLCVSKRCSHPQQPASQVTPQLPPEKTVSSNRLLPRLP